MCFLLQVLLFAGASASAYAAVGVLHAPYWAGGVSGIVFLVVAWFGYLSYQGRHPDWWPPWDEGLPQETRMMNAFVPAAGVFLLTLVLIPTFQAARQRAMQKRLRLEQQQRGNSGEPRTTERAK